MDIPIPFWFVIVLIIMLIIAAIYSGYRVIDAYRDINRVNRESVEVDKALEEMKKCGFTRKCVKKIMAKYRDNRLLKESIQHCNCKIYNDCK